MSGKKSKLDSEPVKVKSEGAPEKVHFPVWFSRQVKAGKLKFWQEREVSVFFREKGLSEREESDRYSEVLKLY